MTAFDHAAGLARSGNDASTRPRFGESAPFLDQGRAQNTLRHELQKLFDEIESRIDDASALDPDTIIEVSSVPNRIVARHGTVAISFSWLTGRLGGVSDGHLLVIQWGGLSATRRGSEALKTATASRETSYHPEADDAASWGWRAGPEKGRACTTLDLVREWFDESAVARLNTPMPIIS
jgi:hypothetical protein